MTLNDGPRQPTRGCLLKLSSFYVFNVHYTVTTLYRDTGLQYTVVIHCLTRAVA